MKKQISIIIAFTLLFSSLFANENKINWLGNQDTFKLSAATDGIIAGTALSLNGAYLVCDKLLNTKNATFDGNLFKTSADCHCEVNSFDKTFMNPYNENLHKLGTITTLTAIAFPAVLAITPKEEWFTIGSMYAESILLANGIKEITKLIVDRPRPYMYYDGYPKDKIDDGDWCKSFPSGHTTISFTAATFNSYVFCKYFPDSPWKYAVIGGSYALAFATAGLRMASGNHFFSDVLTGAVLGSFCGFIVPWLHTLNTDNKSTHGSLGPNASIAPTAYPLGFAVNISL